MQFVPIEQVAMGEKLDYRPALDGIRALSIALVLAFHLGAPWLPGGYLGVSVFFTLSGYLITSLLLSERAATGRIDVRAFYVRRLRRLLPASLLCLTGIAVLAAVGLVVERADLRVGLLGALFQVANWEHLLGNRSYADLFVAPSPIDHFWSLAIEEQFYWAWPLVVAGLTAVAPRRSSRLIVGGFIVSGAAAVVTARLLGGDAAYFASWARFAEILAGAALAALLAGRAVPARAALLAPVCLVAIAVLAVVTPAGRGWAYDGGLPLFALLSTGLVLGVQAPGPIARVLGREPIPWIGRISYGLYLFHWPVFTVLSDAGVAEMLATTLALTVASYYVLERPIRTGRVLVTRAAYLRVAGLSFAATAAVVAVTVPVARTVQRDASPTVISAAAPDTTARSMTLSSSVIRSFSPTLSPTPVPAPSKAAPAAAAPSRTIPAPRVIALFGDSVADWLLRDASPTFARTDVTLVDAAVEGCDAARDIPAARGRVGQTLPLPDDCTAWPEAYPAAVEDPSLPVDVAVLVLGNAPMVDRRVGGRWIGPCDTIDWYVADLRARVAYLRQHVERVVFALPSWGGPNARFLASDDHLERMSCIRAQLEVFASRAGVDTVDLATLLCPDGPAGTCADARERDGTHVDPEDAPAVLDWLLDQVAAS